MVLFYCFDICMHNNDTYLSDNKIYVCDKKYNHIIY